MEHLASGYNAYHLREKAAHYGRARERACAAAASLLILGDLVPDSGTMATLADRLETEAVSAIGGLIRTIEKKENKDGRRNG